MLLHGAFADASSWAGIIAELQERGVQVLAPALPLVLGAVGDGASARRRGAIVVAQSALERAAELSVDPTGKGRRLVGAAQLAYELGRREAVLRLLRQAEPLELGPLERARVSWLRETLDDAAWSGDSQIRSFVEIADRLRREGIPRRH